MVRNVVSEKIFRKLILEAKSPEELMKLIKYRYAKDVPETFIDNVFAIDPTKKKSFTRWACEKYANESKDFENDLEDGTLKKVFDYFYKNSNKFSMADMKTLEEAKSYAFTVYLDEYLKKDGDGPENDYEYWDVDDTWIVAKYNTYDASLKLGKDCVWCTANWYGNGESYYEHYTKSGNTFILIDKTESEICNKRRYNFKRYQIFFCNNNTDDEFRNSKNETVENNEIGITENVEEFFSDRGFDITDVGKSYEERWEDYCQWRWENRLMTIHVGDQEFNVLPEYEEEMDIRNAEDIDYAIYYDDDDVSEIDNTPVESKPYFENADIKNGKTFTIFNTKDDVYMWYVKGNSIYGKWDTADALYEIGEPFSYAYLDSVFVFEKGEDNWVIEIGKEAMDSVMVPEQLGDGSIHVNITTDDDVTFLMNLSEDGSYAAERYVKNAVFELRNGKYVAVTRTEDGGVENGEGDELIDGRYTLLDIPYINPDECKVLPCLDNFSTNPNKTYLYNKENGEIMPWEYKGWSVCGGYLFLSNSNYTNYDIMNLKTGEFFIRHCILKTISHTDRILLLNPNNGEDFIFFKDCGDVAKMFRAKEVYQNDSVLARISCDSGNGLLYLKTFEFEPGIKDMFIIKPGEEYVIENEENVIFSTKLVNDKLVTDKLIGKIKIDDIKTSKNKEGRVILSFVPEEANLYSLYDCWDKKIILKDCADHIYCNNYIEVIYLVKNTKVQVYDIKKMKFLANGFAFDEAYLDGPHLFVSRPLVKISFGIESDTREVYPQTAFFKDCVGTDSLMVYSSSIYQIFNDGTIPEVYKYALRDKHVKAVMEIKQEIQNASPNTQVNESMLKQFYSILESIESSRYNWL